MKITIQNLQKFICSSHVGRGFGIVLLFLFTFMVGSCGDDEPTPEESVTPSYLTMGTDERPTTWLSPDYSKFEVPMSVQVQLGDELASYISEKDLMCAMINGEVRAVTGPMKTGSVSYFPLVIAGSGGETTIDLHYYCDHLHRIFVITNWASFNAAAAPTGESGLYRPCFGKED